MPLSETVGRTSQDAKTYSLPHPIGLKCLLMNNRKGFQIYLWLRWTRKFGQVAK